jgi:hypothetical protein
MKTLIAMTMFLALGLVFPTMAADKEEHDEFENRVTQINAMGAKPNMTDIALQRISTETGVPVETVRKQHGRHPNIGVAGLMIANVLANETKKAPESFLSQREGGKKWKQIAKQNNVGVEKLNDRLERLQKAMKGTT